LGKTIQEKVSNLSTASSAAEAQAALTKPTTKPPPKTLNHALARASLAGSELLGNQDHFGAALGKYSASLEKIGNARLQQDNQIVSRFNSAMSTTVNSHIAFAMKARRAVQNARLTLDAAKATAKNARPERADAARVEVEHAEDAFVGMSTPLYLYMC
jgi:Bin/amphiphysin/Rvs domain for vesicular trafficking